MTARVRCERRRGFAAVRVTFPGGWRVDVFANRDAHPSRIRSGLGRGRVVRGWTVTVAVGRGAWIGAGYRGGRTVFAAFRPASSRWDGRRGMLPAWSTWSGLDIGATRNANRVPITGG